MKQATPSSKPYAALATGLIAKYRHNPSLRMTVYLVLLQIAFTILMIALFGYALHNAQLDTVGSISQHISNVLNGHGTTTDSLPETIGAISTRIFILVSIGMIVLNALFAYLVALFALRPTQDTLSFQKRFIGNIAHELRTPLAIIKTSTEVALFEPNLSPSLHEALTDTITELDRISETINNLLSFDTLTRPTRMKFTPVDLGEVVDAVVVRHEELARSRGVSLVYTPMPGQIVRGNASALDQVVNNLLKNAINYTPQNKDGRVEVGLLSTRTYITISVKDTGIGIKEEDMQHIFEPFYRGDTSRARGIGTGTSGLGLAIVNEIVRLHQGSITIRSTLGKGTSIRVTLPHLKKETGVPGNDDHVFIEV